MSDKLMNAVYYHAPRNVEVRRVPVPQAKDDDVLIKVSCCGVCGTDSHVHDGDFIAKYPLIPGHEIVGTITEVGKNVKGLSVGDRCVADPCITCDTCFFCRRGQGVLCENFNAKGVTIEGGFAEFVTFHYKKVYKITNLTDEEATLVEPTSCAIHGIDRLNSPVGIEALVIGAGPSGLVLAQLLKLNGASRVVVAANKGIKTEVAKQLDAADEYVELDRKDPGAQWEKLKKDNPYGFDVVIEATGNAKVVDESINYVRRGGTLMLYSIYDQASHVHWSPTKIFGDEIRIIGSVAQAHCFPRAVAYLDSGKIRVKGMVTHVFGLDEHSKALEKMVDRQAMKVAIRP